MSYSEGTYIRPRYPLIYFDDIHSRSINGVTDEKQECEDKLAKIRERLAILIAGNPRDLMGDDIDTPTWISEQIDDIEEDLREILKKEGRLEIFGDMLCDWEDSVFSDRNHETIYNDVNLSNKSDNSFVFPKDEFVNNTNDRFLVSIGSKLPEEKSFEELFNDGLRNIELEKPNRDIIENLIFAIVDGRLFTTYTGQWLFKDKSDAITAIKHKLNISILPFTSIPFVKAHPEFFDSVYQYVTDENEVKFMKECVENPDSLGTIVSKTYNTFYNIFQRAYDNFLESKIKIHKISEIIN